MNARTTLLSAALLSTPCLAGSLGAQSGVGALLDSSSSSRQVDSSHVLEFARGSFQVALERLLVGEDSGGPSLPEADTLSLERREALWHRAFEEFEAELELEISELCGDGILLADEVSLAAGELRDEHLDRLREDVKAEALGAPPVPRSGDDKDAWAYRMELLRYVVLERNHWSDWATLLGAALAGLTLAVGVLRISSSRSEPESDGGGRALARSLLDNLHGPLYLLLATGGLALGLRSVWLPRPVSGPVSSGLWVLVVLGAFWMTWRLSASLPMRAGKWFTPEGEPPGPQVLEVVRKLLRLGVILVFAVLGVEVLFGADFTALLAGLGIVGLAVTLAAQDTLKDLFAALTIHLNQPFALGALIRFAGHFGTVEEIGFRMTRLRTLDGHLVTIPNAKLVSESVENVSARPFVRRRFHLDLPYETPVGRISAAVEAVREVIRDAGDLDPEQDVQVHFDEFGAHSFRLLVQYCFGSGDYWASKEKATEIDLALVERLREEGIELAFPTQTLHVRDGAGFEGEEERGAPLEDEGASDPGQGEAENDAKD